MIVRLNAALPVGSVRLPPKEVVVAALVAIVNTADCVALAFCTVPNAPPLETRPLTVKFTPLSVSVLRAAEGQRGGRGTQQSDRRSVAERDTAGARGRDRAAVGPKAEEPIGGVGHAAGEQQGAAVENQVARGTACSAEIAGIAAVGQQT